MADPLQTIRGLEGEIDRMGQEIRRLDSLRRSDLVRALDLAREAHDCLVLGARPEGQARIRELCRMLTVALGGA